MINDTFLYPIIFGLISGARKKAITSSHNFVLIGHKSFISDANFATNKNNLRKNFYNLPPKKKLKRPNDKRYSDKRGLYPDSKIH